MTATFMNGETWIICGGRDFTDAALFNSAMSDLLALRGCPACVVEGGASGADRLAFAWATRRALSIREVNAGWDTNGKAAGPIRNQKMLDDYRPALVVAFPGGRGTADMVRRARAANVDVAQVFAERPQAPEVQTDGVVAILKTNG